MSSLGLATTANATQLLNPHTPMAFLPPPYATKLTIQTYAILASLAVLIWDILIYLPVDYSLLVQNQVNRSFVIYCLSRLTTLAYMGGLTVASTFPLGDCNIVQKLSYVYPFTTPSTLLLFALRTSALYNNNIYMVAFLSLSWLGVLACSILVPFGVSGYEIANTGYCIEIKTQVANAFMEIAPFVHDTIVFFATSWGLSNNSYSDGNKLQAMFLGKYLPTFSKSMLHDGQAYYLATLTLGVGTTVAYALPIQAITSCTIGIPHFVLMHTMSCYVYRNVRLGVYKTSSFSSSCIERQLETPVGQKLEAMEFSSYRSGNASFPSFSAERIAANRDDNSRFAADTEFHSNKGAALFF